MKRTRKKVVEAPWKSVGFVTGWGGFEDGNIKLPFHPQKPSLPSPKSRNLAFPTERYGHTGKNCDAGVYDSDPTKPIGSFKKAWQTAKKEAAVHCRFHDLRHTACTRMLEAAVPFSVVASIMGWSPSTTVLMARRYGHIGQAARREPVETIGRQAGSMTPVHEEESTTGERIN